MTLTLAHENFPDIMPNDAFNLTYDTDNGFKSDICVSNVKVVDGKIHIKRLMAVGPIPDYLITNGELSYVGEVKSTEHTLVIGIFSSQGNLTHSLHVQTGEFFLTATNLSNDKTDSLKVDFTADIRAIWIR